MTLGAPAGLVKVVSPAPRAEWKSVLESSRERTVFHTPEWLDALCRTGGFEDASRLYETADGTTIIVPMVRRRGPRPMRTTWSMPGSWGGAIGSRRLAPEDVAMVLDDVLETSTRLIVTPRPPTVRAWNAARASGRFRHSFHVLDIRDGFEALWSNHFSRGTRNKIRRAEKERVEVQWGSGSELMKIYWDIYLRWTIGRAEERGIPVPLGLALAKRRESLARFEAIARCLGDRCQVGIAWINGEAAAAAIMLVNGPDAHYWRSASDKALIGRRCANYLVVARLLEKAAARGCEYVDMGESGGVRSLAEFKEHFGARPASYEELRFEPRIVTRAVRARHWLVQNAGDVALKSGARLKRWSDSREISRETRSPASRRRARADRAP